MALELVSESALREQLDPTCRFFKTLGNAIILNLFDETVQVVVIEVFEHLDVGVDFLIKGND